MGGREASRGFVYQGIASVLEALTIKDNCNGEDNWDRIYIEYQTPKDKVDIALEKENKIIKSIQVKSTENVFSKPDIKKWLDEIVEDIESPKYELFLIGQCSEAANKFIKSIQKYYDTAMDKEAELSLKGFDVSLLDNKKIQITILPFKIEILERIVRDSLHQYISYSNQVMTFEQINFIAEAMIGEQMISSTHGNGVDREELDKNIQDRIRMLEEKYSKRISIKVQSLGGGTEKLEKTENCLSLIEKFDGRFIKDGYDWNKDIYKNLEKFLLTNISEGKNYQIFLDVHLSIAFAVGRIINSQLRGSDIFPIQKSPISGTALWEVNPLSKKEYVHWNISYETLNENQNDSALVLNVTLDIYDEVIRFIQTNHLPIGRIINCTLDKIGATNHSIEDGTHAMKLANSVYNAVVKRSTMERRATLHIFACVPIAFMYFLGQNSIGFGKCVLYEYDLGQKNSGTYSQSISFV